MIERTPPTYPPLSTFGEGEGGSEIGVDTVQYFFFYFEVEASFVMNTKKEEENLELFVKDFDKKKFRK